jgi:hypothetical protein
LKPGLKIPLPEEFFKIRAKTTSSAGSLGLSGKTVFVVTQLSGFFETGNLKRKKLKLEMFKARNVAWRVLKCIFGCKIVAMEVVYLQLCSFFV